MNYKKQIILVLSFLLSFSCVRPVHVQDHVSLQEQQELKMLLKELQKHESVLKDAEDSEMFSQNAVVNIIATTGMMLLFWYFCDVEMPGRRDYVCMDGCAGSMDYASKCCQSFFKE